MTSPRPSETPDALDALQQLAEADVEAIRVRAALATPGPWGHYTPRGAAWPNPDPIFGATPGDEVAWSSRRRDWHFIANAREDIPALLRDREVLLERLRNAEAKLDRDRLERLIEMNEPSHVVADAILSDESENVE